VLIPFMSGKRHSYAQITEAVQMCLMYRNTLWAAIILNITLTMSMVIVSTTMLFYLFQLYEINDDPKRKEFLDDLFSFMQKRGKSIESLFHRQYIHRGADKSLARPTSRCVLFDGENISFDASLVRYI